MVLRHAPAGVPRARSSVFLGPSSMALQGEYSESLSLSHEVTEVNQARRSHAGPRKNLRDSRLHPPPLRQARAARGKCAEAPSACCMTIAKLEASEAIG